MIITEDIDPSMQSEVGGNYGYMAAKNCIKRILSLISRTKRIILVFDDLQYMDAMSLDLLASVVSSQNDRILILSACQEEMGLQAEKFISSLIKNNMLTRISLKPFSFEDACLYTKMQFGKKMPDEATLRKIYRNSDGNPFFLAEIVAGLKNGLGDTVLSKNTQIVLNDRLNSISPEVRQLVDVLSIFKHSVPLDMLIYILNKTESEILHITEEFKYSSIVEEHSEGGKVVFSFKHNKMHEFAYERLSPSKKRILHNRAGYAYEKIYASNLTPYYKRIICRFSIGENTPKALEYEVLELEQYINIIFDLYPVLSSDYEEKALQPDEIEERFDNIDARLHSIKSNPEISGKYDELEAKVLRARSRYYILRGNYTDGVRYNDMLMGSNTVKDSPLSLVKCMRTMIYYGIQTDNTALMKEYLDRAFSLLDKIDNPDETAIMYRLRGLYEILAGYPENAMPYLDQSIKILEKNVLNSSIYALNIAAAFNYMGEACRTQKNYEEAINHYHDAISLCEKNNCLVNPTFYTNMAVAHLQNRNKEKAYELFITAVSLYDVSTVLMKRSIAKSYAACYYCEKNDFPAAASSLKEADHFSKLLGSPSEQQIYEKNLNNLKAKYKNKLEQYL